ncbi:MAG: nitrilase [Gammaproteobacteria bacterium]|nr:nitrilase [Gammaproteobacteria bacterium]MBU1926682.1 nitrilase [Gammaproteobacteria bacterium]MBU2546239.1 nitrilase [Gammaproteobacteria bacterium]
MRLLCKSLFISIFILFSTTTFAARLLQPAGPANSQQVQTGLHSVKYKLNIYDTPPAFGEGLRIASFQNWGRSGTKQAMNANFKQLVTMVKKAKQYGAQLIGFPELYLPGYALSPQDAKNLALTKNSPEIQKIQKIAKQYNVAIVLPYAEKAQINGKWKYFDAIAFINNHGKLLESYRKTHLFGIAERLNWSAGNGPYNVYKINGFPVGILNCYEAEFPELSRILALKGAKLIVIPTAADTYWKMYNGQWTDVRYPDISKLLLPAFSYANNIFISYINHAGYEFLGKDFWHYEGNSTVVDPHGKVVLSADKDQATLLIADVVPKYYGPTHPENANYLRDRRPRLYEELLKTKVKFDGGHVYPRYPQGEDIYPGFPK